MVSEIKLQLPLSSIKTIAILAVSAGKITKKWTLENSCLKNFEKAKRVMRF